MRAMTAESIAPPAGRAVLWAGSTEGTELALARSSIAPLARVFDATVAAEAAAAVPADVEPAIVFLASARPGTWTLADAVGISRRWPLAALVAVTTSLGDGRRRSGPPLPGIEAVAWNDLAGRLAWWLHDFATGRPGTLSVPATARREERLLAAAARLHDWSATAARLPPVALAAERAVELESLADLFAALGVPVAARFRGRPALDDQAGIVVWDATALGMSHLAWIEMLAAERPDRRLIVLDSFPRGDLAAAALRAGASAVLSRPVTLETLAGTLVGLDSGRGTGLGGPDAPA